VIAEDRIISLAGEIRTSVCMGFLSTALTIEAWNWPPNLPPIPSVLSASAILRIDMPQLRMS
jgi:hypothetical protein